MYFGAGRVAGKLGEKFWKGGNHKEEKSQNMCVSLPHTDIKFADL